MFERRRLDFGVRAHEKFNTLMVCEVKLEIMDQMGIPTARQQLIFEDEVLIDGRRLISYNIRDGSTIWLMQVTPTVTYAWEEPDVFDV